MADEQMDLLNKELEKIKDSKNLDEKDREKILDYFKSRKSQNLILSPNILSTFLQYAQTVGFPSTKSMIEFSMGENKKKADAAILALKAAKVLDTYKVAGGVMKDIINRSWKDDKSIKSNPDKEIEVYDYNPDFVSKLGLIVGKLNLKSEEYMSSKKIIQEGKDVLNKLRRDLELKTSISEAEIDMSGDEDDFFQHLDNDTVEKLMDGLLLVVSELEAEGKIKKFKKPSDAKSALMAAIRKMYQSRGLIGKEARKIQRAGGEKRIIRQAKRDIQKAR